MGWDHYSRLDRKSTQGLVMRAQSPATTTARHLLAALSVLGFAALTWASFASPLPRLVYNASSSTPIGWYRIEPLDRRAAVPAFGLHVDSIVLARLSADAAAVAGQRGYLPAHLPLLKRVGALPPQQVCIVDGSVRIDGVLVATVQRADRMGRALQPWLQCRRLNAGEVFLLGTAHPTSFDSRYFGPIPASAVLGVAHPVWVEARQ